MAENAVVRSGINVIVEDEAIPFDLNPNKLTRKTLRKCARGEGVHRAADAKDLFEKLGIRLTNDQDLGVSG